jgi:hypothetical protein
MKEVLKIVDPNYFNPFPDVWCIGKKRKSHHLGTNEAPEGLRWEDPPGARNAQILVDYLTSQFFGWGSTIVSFSGDVPVGITNVG